MVRRENGSLWCSVHPCPNVRLFTFLVRLSRRRDVAEDLLEETWLRLVKQARRLRPDTRLGASLFTVARNLHISYHRSRMLEDSAAASLIGLWPFSPERLSPFEVAAASELERRIEQALAARPVASREVLRLVAVAGLNHSDAADVCGITPETLRQRLRRARASLSTALERGAAIGVSTQGDMTPCPNR